MLNKARIFANLLERFTPTELQKLHDLDAAHEVHSCAFIDYIRDPDYWQGKIDTGSLAGHAAKMRTLPWWLDVAHMIGEPFRGTALMLNGTCWSGDQISGELHRVPYIHPEPGPSWEVPGK